MTIVYPTSDIDAVGWTDEVGGTSNLYTHVDEVSHSAADYVTTTFLGAASGETPRVLVILMDDMRYDDLFTKMTPTGGRPSEYCLQQTRDRIIFTPDTLFVPYFWDDYALCGPARIEILTGLYYRNHNLKNDEHAYYVHGRFGAKNDTPVFGTTPFMCGPWEFDLAHMFGLPHTPVTQANQNAGISGIFAPIPYIGLAADGNRKRSPFGNASSMGTFTRGLVADVSDTTGGSDDLQAYTGSLANWLAEFGITCCFVGKYHNGYASPTTGTSAGALGLAFSFPIGTGNGTRFAPPGWSHWYAVTGDETTFAGDIQDHFHTRMNLFDGVNPGDGMGAYGSERYYAYDWHVVAASWASNKITFSLAKPILSDDDSVYFVRNTVTNAAWTSTAGGTITFTTSVGHGLSAGRAFSTTGFVPSGYNVTGVIAATPTATTFTVTGISNPGSTPASTNGVVSSPIATAIGYANITDDTSTYTWVADLHVGDEVDIDGVGVGYDALRFVVTDVYNGGGNGLGVHQFKVARTGSLSAASCDLHSRCYIHKYFSDVLFGMQAIDILDQLGDDEPWYLQWNPRAPHGDVEGGVVEHEWRYDFTVQDDILPGNMQFSHWNGGPGCVYFVNNTGSPAAIHTTGTSVKTITITLADLPDTGTWPGNTTIEVGDKFVILNTGTRYDSRTFNPSTSYYDTVTSVNLAAGTFQCQRTDATSYADFNGNPYHASTAQVQFKKYVSPAIDFLGDGTSSDFPISRGQRRTIFSERQEMLPSTDDGIGMILDYIEGRGWTNVVVIFTSDNGYADGEHRATETSDAWSGVGAKGWVWESSTRLPLYIYNSSIMGAGTSTVRASMADIPLTVMDLFAPAFPSLALHHAHFKRDGYSLARLNANPLDPVHDRAIFCSGKFHGQANCSTIITRDMEKYIHNPHTVGTVPRELYDLSDTILGTPGFLTSDMGEQNNLYGVNPTRDAQLEAYLNAAETQRYSIALNRNTCRDAVI